MNWEYLIKVATLIIGALSLIDKGYELVKKRQARQARRHLISRHTKSANWSLNLKNKLSSFHLLPQNDLVLLSNFIARGYLLKKIS